jgi:hypothetical protein
MKQSVWTTTSTSQAQAFITKRKQRLKQINRNIYLKDGDEYEIELFNPNSSYILAKIKIDGDYLSGGGIVLRPGERVFLERFLDSKNKFVFRTYNVDGEAEYVGALRNNGLIEVEFYLEQQKNMLYGNNTFTTSTPYTFNGNPTTFTTTGAGVGTATGTYTSTNVNLSASTTSNSTTYLSNTIETGTTERGSNSNQQFTNSDRSFKWSPFQTTIWKILPESQKKYDAKELNVLYCGECGSKRKKDTHKFCPHCGTKF